MPTSAQPATPNKTTIAEIRGKLGAWVYARNRFGPLRRPWRPPTMALSPAQSTWQLIFQAAALRWNANLSDAQRQAWRTFAAGLPRHGSLGQTYTPTGQNQHAGRNAITFNFGKAFLDNPPLDILVTQPASLAITTATHSPQALTILINAQFNANEVWVLAATPQQNVGFNNPARIWRPLAFGSNTLPYTYNAITAYTGNFAALLPGKKLWAKFQIANITNGSISRGITASITCT